jgi:hypothetical protein
MVLDQVTDMKVKQLGQHGFRPGYSHESYGLSGYRGFIGPGSQDRRSDNRVLKCVRFSSV